MAKVRIETKVPVVKTFKDLFAERIEKYNHNHDPATGRFTSGPSMSANGKGGGGGGKGGNLFETDVTDALEEMTRPKSQGGKNLHFSLEGHITSDGKLTPEREAEHVKIINKLLEGKTADPSGQGTLRMMGGGAASGKRSALNSGLIPKFDESHHVTVDPDKIKEMLPGYDELAKKSTDAAGIYHEESSALAKRLYKVALDRGINVTYDGTGNNSPGSVLKKVDQAREKGYKVEAVYMTLSIPEAQRRNQARYDHAVEKFESGKSDRPPRRPDPAVVEKIHRSVSDVAIEVAPKFDSIRLYDNEVPQGSKPRLVAKGGNGKGLRAVAGKGKKELFQSFCDKGYKGHKVGSDGRIIPATPKNKK